MKHPIQILLVGTITLLTGCSTANHVNQIIQPQSKVFKGDDGRYVNQYSGEKTYPLSCTENCYQPRPELQCETDQPAERCKYIGPKPTLALNSGFKVKWLGHASFQVTTDNGQQFLFDPVTAQFDWPVDLAFRLDSGFYRNLPAKLTEQELTHANAIMYSHVHYDHFNKQDIADIGVNTPFYVPLGLGDHFPNDGYQINEMAWYSKQQVGDTTIQSVPAHHFSNRIWVPFLYEDWAKASWNGWVLESKGKKLFFAGDTGYSAHFADIKQQLGDIDICLLPIASYHHPEDANWYRYVHMTPEDALTAAQDLGCKVMIPWGYGNASWKMGDISSHSALVRLLNMKEQMGSTMPILVLNEGDAISL